MSESSPILWLASWYPTKLDPYPGDFIQRHAKAFALYHPVHVLHIAKDESGILTRNILIEEKISGNLHETIVYYHPFKTGFLIFDKLVSRYRFRNVGKRVIRKIIKEQPTPFIHLHVAMRHGLLARWAKRDLKLQYVITEHWAGYDRSTYPEQLRPPKWYWAVTKKIFRDALYFYPEVNRMGELVNETITPVKYKPVSNSVDTTLFNNKAVKSNADKIFHFIHVSTLSYQKNIEGILRVIKKWAVDHANVHFTFVGPASDEIIKYINNSPVLSKIVTVTGALPYEHVAKEMQKADALLMFSRYENQPCVILEALCCGLPVISTNVGGIAEVIDQSNGFLIESENEQALYEALTNMMLQYKKFNCEEISRTACEKYSYETTGKLLLDYYKQDIPAFSKQL